MLYQGFPTAGGPLKVYIRGSLHSLCDTHSNYPNGQTELLIVQRIIISHMTVWCQRKHAELHMWVFWGGLRQFWAWQWINSWPDQKSPVSFAVEDTWYMVTNQPSLSLQVSIDLGKAVAWCSWEQALYDWSLPRQQSSLALLTTALTSTHLRNEDSGVLHRWETAVLSSSYILCCTSSTLFI